MKTGRATSARQCARRRSSALPDGRPMRKTVGGQDGGLGVDQMRMALYSKAWSLSCWRIKRLFKRRGYVFEVVDITDDGSCALLIESTGCKAVPQVFVAGRWVGGFEVIKALDRTGNLDRLVRGEV